jgi:cytochrome c-type biogenesis protein CcsB
MKLFTINDYQFPIIASILLLFSMLFYWTSLCFPEQKLFFKIARSLIFLTNFILAFTLAIRWVGDGYFPLSNLYESLIFLSWAISSVHLVVESQTKSCLLGAISTPLLCFLSGFSSLTLPVEMQKAMPLVPSLQSNWLMMHVSMMMVSYATLLVGSLLSILYLAFFYFLSQDFQFSFNNSENQSLKTQSLVQIPSKFSLLETIDVLSYRILGLGFPFLTIGILSGAVWANEAWGSAWSWDPKETWAFITWLVFAIYFHSRLLKGWQGQKAALLGSFGFFVIWICYLGVNFLGKGLHSYGWVG